MPRQGSSILWPTTGKAGGFSGLFCIVNSFQKFIERCRLQDAVDAPFIRGRPPIEQLAVDAALIMVVAFLIPSGLVGRGQPCAPLRLPALLLALLAPALAFARPARAAAIASGLSVRVTSCAAIAREAIAAFA